MSEQLAALVQNYDVLKDSLNTGMEILIEAATDVVHSQAPGSSQLVAMLQESLQALVKKEYEMKAELAALENMRNTLQRGEEIVQVNLEQLTIGRLARVL